MLGFENAFGVPDGHRLRQVHPASRDQAGRGQARAAARRWEHEGYDERGRLVAVYESWAREDGDGGDLRFVKYSPHGWVLSVCGRSVRAPTPQARHRSRVEAA